MRENSFDGGRGRYRLTDQEECVWGEAGEVDGLFGEPPRGTYELFDWSPEGAGPGRWVGDRVWLVPDDITLEPWLLQEVEADGPVLTGLGTYNSPPEGHRGRVRLHDGQQWLGSCQGFTLVQPPAPAPAPLVLRGLAPGEQLRAALAKGTRRALDLETAALEVLDDRGEPFTQRFFWARVSGWQPSASAGPELIDLELDGGFLTPVPSHARPVWERWLAGPPDTPGAWAGLDTRLRGAWLDLVRDRAGWSRRPDRPAGHAYELDGRWITDVPGLYLALGEAVNGPGGYFGANLDALVDCLRGTFGYTAPATLLWHDAATARNHLSHALTPEGEPYDLFGSVLELLAEGGMTVTPA